jgi:hypothetical protein
LVGCIDLYHKRDGLLRRAFQTQGLVPVVAARHHLRRELARQRLGVILKLYLGPLRSCLVNCYKAAPL